MKALQFTKMHGLGNDFIIIDSISQNVELSEQQIRAMADRHFGIGFDQLLLVEKTIRANVDFKYRIFNADGGEVEQCGNGARCFARFVQEKGLLSKHNNSQPIVVETANGIISLFIGDEADEIRVDMGIPDFLPQSLPFIPLSTPLSTPQPTAQATPPGEVDVENNRYQVCLDELNLTLNFSAVSIGNPHITIIVDDLENYPVTAVGKILESHACFPKRVNVGFMQIVAADHIRLRVFERGAGETLACGSGACAAVVNGISRGLLQGQVKVDLHGGSLKISWDGSQQPVWMTGSASFVYEGQINL